MKLFVWDFHGVLEKDNEKAVIAISNAVLEQAGHSARFTDEHNEEFYGLKWYEYFQRLMPQLSPAECLDLQAACFTYSEQNLQVLVDYIKPNDHAGEVLAAIAKAGHQQIVISNTRQKDLHWFLETVGLEAYFDKAHVIGVNAHQKHGNKVEALKNFTRGKSFDEIIAIGDSESDLTMGKAVGATTFYYKHGHRAHEPSDNADHVIKDLRDVLGAI